MKKTFFNYSGPSDRPALTLVEVITSIVLLSTLLVGMLTAYTRHVRQLDRATDIKHAVQLTDQLLGRWFANHHELPVSQSGYLDAEAGLVWQLQEQPGGSARFSGARVLELSVFDIDAASIEPLIRLELLDSVQHKTTGGTGP